MNLDRANLKSVVHLIPIWLWIILPSILVLVGVALYTKNKRYTLIATLMCLTATVFAVTLHSFEVYLHDHFVGGFDKHGLPANFSRNGWHMFFTAWPVWLFPCFVTLAMSMVLYWLWLSKKTGRTAIQTFTDFANDVPIGDSQNAIKYKLALKENERALAIANEKYRQLKESSSTPVKPEKYLRQLARMRQLMQERQQSVTKLKEQLEEKEQELERANDLIDHLLNEKYEQNDSSDDDMPPPPAPPNREY